MIKKARAFEQILLVLLAILVAIALFPQISLAEELVAEEGVAVLTDSPQSAGDAAGGDEYDGGEVTADNSLLDTNPETAPDAALDVAPEDDGDSADAEDAEADGHTEDADEETGDVLEAFAGAPAGAVTPKDTSNTALTDGAYYTLIPKNTTTRVLDVNGSSSVNGAAITLWQANLGANQNFRFVPVGDGTFTIVAEHSGKVVDVTGASTNPGTNIIQWSANSGINQRWYFTANSDGSYTIHSALGSARNDLVLDIERASDSNGGRLITYTNNGQGNQHFTFRQAYPRSTVNLASGYYQIELSYASGKILDIPNSSLAAMTNPIVYLRKQPAGFNQLFKFTQVGDYYTIQAVVSGLYLDVSGGSRLPGAAIIQYPYHGGDNQLWGLTSADGGKTVTLYSKGTGAVVDIPNGSTADYIKPIMYQYHDATNQRFKLVPATLPVAQSLADGIYSIISTANNSLTVDVPNVSRVDGTGLIVYGTNKGINQKFQIAAVSANTYTIKSLCSGLYLTDRSSAVVQKPATGGSDQQWRYLSGTGGYQLLNVGTGRVVSLASTASEAKLQTVNASTTTGLVGLVFVEEAILEDSYYTVVSKTGTVLGVSGASLKTGERLVSEKGTGADSQKFFIKLQTDNQGNTYTLATALIGKLVDVSGGVTAPDTPVIQNTYTAGATQLWDVRPTGDGWFTIKAKAGDAYMTAVGGAIVVRPGDGSDSQKFFFTPTTYIRALLDGIDVSSWQPADIGWRVDYDFMIVKASGGVSYTNPSFKTQADAALSRGKLLGLYHYAAEYHSQNSAQAEALFFVNTIRPYIGKAVLFLDYEEDLPGRDRDWISAFCTEVKRLSGISCHIYASGSWASGNIPGVWNELGVMLWQANYWYSTLPDAGYRRDITPMISCSIYQYTSQGRLPGYAGSLDLNVFYGKTTDWNYWARH